MLTNEPEAQHLVFWNPLALWYGYHIIVENTL